jgi:hypothetical protein
MTKDKAFIRSCAESFRIWCEEENGGYGLSPFSLQGEIKTRLKSSFARIRNPLPDAANGGLFFGGIKMAFAFPKKADVFVVFTTEYLEKNTASNFVNHDSRRSKYV